MITHIQLNNAKPKDKDYTLKVDNNLSILVKATGSKLWRFRYSFAGKRCMISLGKYPSVTIKQARDLQYEYLELLAQGINPSAQRQLKKAKQATVKSFFEVALEWHAKHYQHSNERHNKLTLARLKNYVFPVIGKLPIQEIEAPMLYNIMESIQQLGYIETGKRVNGACSQVFRYGVAKGYCKRDITSDYRGMLKNSKSKHLPTLTDPEEIGELLRDIHAYSGTKIVKTAMILSAYVFVRPSELANSKWEYIDFKKSHWIIPAELMKMNRDHLIPFPSQVNKLLEELLPITGNSEYIFHNENNPLKAMHSETVNKSLRRIKDGKYIGRIVSHGFRAMASTILNENKFRSDIVEKQLAHQEKNQVRDAYNHAQYLEDRTEMMQWYADYLDSLV